MFGRFREWYEKRHEYARRWQAEHEDGKVLGYFCTYVPEELFYAAGVLPVRVLGSHEPQDVTEPHIFGMFCPVCRDCLAQGLKGRYEYLDGIALAQCCLHMRQAFTSWRLHIPTEYNYYLYFPAKVQTPRAQPYLVEELKMLKKSIEQWTRREVSAEKLRQAIAVYNRNRELLHKVYEYRKREPPLLTGTEAMLLVASSQLVDKADHNRALEALLAVLETREASEDAKDRLMILGSENDDLRFLELVESLGAVFVIEDHCTGSRYFWNLVELAAHENALGALAARYLARPACPSKDWEQRLRLEHILALAHEYKVQGAILVQQKFCDPHELDLPAIAQKFQRENIPTLALEFDVTVPAGQFKVRVEAFLEMLREEDLF
jgi:benzoyl-CoA reductase subunit C